MLLRLAISFVLFFVGGSTWAQTRCAPGAVPGSLQCQPDLEKGGGSTQTIVKTTGKWQKTWGAISDGNNGVGGVSTGKLSKGDAEASAVKQCSARGGMDCKPVFSYYDQCVVALGTLEGGGQGFTQSAISIEEATRLGMAACKEKNSGATCQVVYSGCTDPVFKKF
jgi:hypothetical protein